MQLDLVDVFGSKPLSGNPLAVVRGGEALEAPQMLALTRWLGFSETAFLLPPTDPAADYRVRMFYPAGELPFAGHPTLGSCHAWLAAGGWPRRPGQIVQECAAGLIPIRQEDGRLAFRAPPLLRSGPLSDAERSAAANLVGVPIEAVVDGIHVSNGPGWQLLRLRSADDVLAAEPAAKAPPGTDIGLAGPHDTSGDAAFQVRAFFSDSFGRMTEDSVTGSLNAGIAQSLFAAGLASDSYIAAQGGKVGADGRVHCAQDGAGAVWIGGRCDMIAQGAEISPAI